MVNIFGYELSIKEIIVGIVLLYILIDTLVFLFNGIQNTGPSGCATDDWMEGIFILNTSKKPPTCPSGVKDDGKLYSLNKWRSYALKDKDGKRENCLYEEQVDNVVKDIKDNYVIEGYTPVQLFAYIIIPVATIESIGFWLLSTRASKAEWTFWILIVTVIITGLTTLIKETSGINIDPPARTSCLSYLADGMGFATGDELQYTFMGRKQDGTKCMIEGTYLGTEQGGVEPENSPTIYRGDYSKCSASDLPLY